MKVESREYKFLIDHERFADAKSALESLWEEIEEAVEPLPGVRAKGKFDENETRNVAFLDTPDQTFRQNGLILRRRWEGGDVEYTLKCRSEDRYFAAGTEVRPVPEFEAKPPKFEEDIAPPFRCRFSLSSTISLSEDRGATFRDPPPTLRGAAKLFPLLGTLRANGRPCDWETAVAVVNGVQVRESVWEGSKILFAPEDAAEPAKATVAVILWSRGERERPAVAELSFRVKGPGESFSRDQAAAARDLYRVLLRLDCVRSDAMTKTEYVYRDSSIE
jgi:hypothetical protein